MKLANTDLSEAEEYAIWCEQTRALFFPVANGKQSAEEIPMNSNNGSSSSGSGSSSSSIDVNMNENKDNDDFPYCFYMRMLGSGKRESDQQQASDSSFSQNYSRSSSVNSQFSSISQQQRYIDEDAYAARLTSKLQTQARAIRREQRNKVPDIIPSDNVQWPFRDGTVEAIAATVNEELHEMLMYVRKRNLLSEQLRRQLTQTKFLLAQQNEALRE
ncbi:uncharacterized protein TM35_000042280 [Trypanosoma theileri]|uniref:Uncharacterized protein n=1 Tax=Trypanosoma theileri TaxID=67003 RepID=A0A1X0P4Z1_9TRYP|nr:uncharacterized protein TM35_000042280 [Trypanosoma theileri]ORC92014.1 hypothetical protein TM35_000042280 [Trypanosoma theileri]